MRMLALILVALACACGTANAATPQQTIHQLRAQLAAAKSLGAKQKKQMAALTGQLGAAKSTLATSQSALTAMTADRDAQASNAAAGSATITALQGQVAAQAQGGASAVIAGGPAAMWAAIQSIWQAFPLLPPSAYCGFDKDSSISSGTGLNIAHYSFSDYTNCS